jgi:hypothetical protein
MREIEGTLSIWGGEGSEHFSLYLHQTCIVSDVHRLEMMALKGTMMTHIRR